MGPSHKLLLTKEGEAEENAIVADCPDQLEWFFSIGPFENLKAVE